MKHLRFFSLAIITILTALPSVGQVIEDGEAFYIYRNDGNFDGFFYDQVQEMRYSNIDMEGIEHDVYVVQEVVTNDSVYRIPLTAIDSIGFVQPKVIFNPELKPIEEAGLYPYIRYVRASGHAERDWTIMLKSNIPGSLVPKVGDKLINIPCIPYEDEYVTPEDWQICGKVVEVLHETYDYGDYRIHVKGFDDISDIFKQFICVEQVTTDGQGNSKRRMSGLNEALRASGSAEGNLIDISATLKKAFKMSENCEIEVSGTLGLKVTVTAAYNITWRKFFVKTSLKQDIEVKFGVEVGTDKTIEKTWDLVPEQMAGVMFPACFPIFSIETAPTLFARASGKIAASLTFPAFKYSARQTIILDSDASDFMTTSWDDCTETDEKDKSWLDDIDFSFVFSGSLQAGIKKRIGLQTNHIAKRICEGYVGIDIYAGPRFDANLSVSISDLLKSDWYSTISNTYVKMSRYTLNAEGKASFKYLWKDPKTEKFFEASLDNGSIQLYAVPEFSEFNVELADPRAGTVNYGFTASHHLIFPSYVGLQVDDGFGGRVYNYIHPKRLSMINAQEVIEKKKEYIATRPGTYYFTPFIEVLGERVLDINKRKQIEIKPYLELETNNPTIGPQGGTVVVRYKTNINFSEESSKIDFDEHYLNGLIESGTINKQEKTITFRIKPNTTAVPRVIHIRLNASTQESNNNTLYCNAKINILQDADFSAITHLKVYEDFRIKKYSHTTNDGIPCSFFGDCNTMHDDYLYKHHYKYPCTATIDENKILRVVVNVPLDSSWVYPSYEGESKYKQSGSITGELVYDLSRLYDVGLYEATDSYDKRHYITLVKIHLKRTFNYDYTWTRPNYLTTEIGRRNSELIIKPIDENDIIKTWPYTLSNYNSNFKYDNIEGSGTAIYSLHDTERPNMFNTDINVSYEIDKTTTHEPSLTVYFYSSESAQDPLSKAY